MKPRRFDIGQRIRRFASIATAALALASLGLWVGSIFWSVGYYWERSSVVVQCGGVDFDEFTGPGIDWDAVLRGESSSILMEPMRGFLCQPSMHDHWRRFDVGLRLPYYSASAVGSFGDGVAVTCPFWPFFIIFAGIALLLRRRPSLRFVGPLICGECGYDLRGNVTGRCPECGSVWVK